MPFSAPLPMPTVSAGRRGQTERAGAGDDERRHEHDRGVDEPRLGPEEIPDDEREDREDHHGRHEVAGHDVDDALDRRLRALRVLDHADDVGERRVLADLGGAELEAAGLVDRAADDLIARVLSRRACDSPVIMDSSTALAPSITSPSTGILLAGPHDDDIADQDLFHGQVDLLAVAQHARGLGLQADELLDGFGRAALGLDLKRQAEHDQRDHDRRHVPEHLGELHAREEAGKATATTE